MSLLNDIINLREELERLEYKYSQETPKCTNDKCSWNRPNQRVGCSWSILVEKCKNYKFEENSIDE